MASLVEMRTRELEMVRKSTLSFVTVSSFGFPNSELSGDNMCSCCRQCCRAISKSLGLFQSEQSLGSDQVCFQFLVLNFLLSVSVSICVCALQEPRSRSWTPGGVEEVRKKKKTQILDPGGDQENLVRERLRIVKCPGFLRSEQ